MTLGEILGLPRGIAPTSAGGIRIIECDGDLFGCGTGIDLLDLMAEIAVAVIGSRLRVFTAVVDKLIHDGFALRHFKGGGPEPRVDAGRVDLIGNGQGVRLMEVEGDHTVGFLVTALEIEDLQLVGLGRVAVKAEIIQLVGDVLGHIEINIACIDLVLRLGIFIGACLFVGADVVGAFGKIDVAGNATVSAADVEHKMAVDEDPDVVVSAEVEDHVVAGGGLAVLSHGEVDVEDRAEAEVMITGREEAGIALVIIIPFITGNTCIAVINSTQRLFGCISDKSVFTAVITIIALIGSAVVIAETERVDFRYLIGNVAGKEARIKVRKDMHVALTALRDEAAGVKLFIDEPLRRRRV